MYPKIVVDVDIARYGYCIRRRPWDTITSKIEGKNTAIVNDTVHDSTQVVIARAKLTLTNSALGTEVETTTNEAGQNACSMQFKLAAAVVAGDRNMKLILFDEEREFK